MIQGFLFGGDLDHHADSPNQIGKPGNMQVMSWLGQGDLRSALILLLCCKVGGA